MEDTLMTKYRSVLRTILLLALVTCLIILASLGHATRARSSAGAQCYGQTDVPAGNDFVAIAAGMNHSLALKSDGSLAGWGDNVRADDVPAGNNFVAIAAGYYHSLALKSDGSLAGWGDNGNGQTNVPAGNDFVAIAAGWSHSLALKSDGSLVGWGAMVRRADERAGGQRLRGHRRGLAPQPGAEVGRFAGRLGRQWLWADERAGGQRLRGHRRGIRPQPGAEVRRFAGRLGLQ